MARKTKRPRTTRPAATPDADIQKAPDIADAETLPGGPVEDAEILGDESVTPADDTVLASEPDTQAGGDSLVPDAVPGDVPPDAETLPGAAEAGAGPDTITGDPTVAADDTVPPEDMADVEDLARMDGATPDDVTVPGDDTILDLSAEPGSEPLQTAGEAGTEGVVMGEVRSDDAEPAGRPETSGDAPPPVVAAPPPQVIEKRGPGFLPLVLGGLVAGAIGYAIPTFLAPPAPPPAVDDARVAALEARLDELPAGEPTDLSGIEAAQAEMSERIDALAARVDALEAAPVPAASAAEQAAAASTATAAPAVDQEAIDSLRAEIDALSGPSEQIDALAGEVAALSGLPERVGALAERVDALAAELAGLPAPPPDLSDRVAALEAELATLDEETAAVEVSAEQRAREAAANQLRIAVDSGASYAEPLSVIGGDVPAALAGSAEAGVPTVDALRSDFPAAARAALSEARRVEPGGETGLAGFIRRQTGARSLEPREGDDADAVLSRAEAALREGDVDATVSELEALPEEARTVGEMSDWLARARERVEARAALQDYLGTE